MRRVCFTLLLVCTTATLALAQNSLPDSAQLITDDIKHFWEAYDRAAPAFEAGPFQERYLDRGTLGLEGFIKNRIQSAENLAQTIRARPGYYASIRESTLRIQEMETQARASFYALKYLYPDAIFPNVYFVIGVMNSGGTTSARAIIVGAEMYGLTPEAPLDELNAWLMVVLEPVESVPHLVAHELIHIQQHYPIAPPKLLSQSIKEGAADFLSELISGRHINKNVHAYANPHEEALWGEFQQRMHGKEYAGWLYSASEGRPNDLGYWMGYKITKAYYERADDKRQAIYDILQIDDFDAFVTASGYAEKFDR